MQLTPRTLGMALGACLAGGLVLGIAGTLSPSIAVAGAPAQPTNSASTYSAAELGDAQSTFASDSPTSSPSPSAPASSSSIPFSDSASTSGGDFSSPTPSTIAASARANASQGTARANQTTARPLGKPRAEEPIAAPTPQVKTTPSRAPRPTIKLTKPEPSGGWSTPQLAVGVVNIAPPKLTSGERPSMTVMCSPSIACVATGSSLSIGPDAQRVTVTWSSPNGGHWTAWTASSTYSAHVGG